MFKSICNVFRLHYHFILSPNVLFLPLSLPLLFPLPFLVFPLYFVTLFLLSIKLFNELGPCQVFVLNPIRSLEF